MVFFPDGQRTLQRKHRIQDPEMGIAPVTPGPRERALFHLKGFTCVVLICSDNDIDGIYEELARKGCDMVILITADAGHESFGFHKADLSDPEKLKKFAQTTAKECLAEDFVARSFKLQMAQCSGTGLGAFPSWWHYFAMGSSMGYWLGRRGAFLEVFPEWLRRGESFPYRSTTQRI
jgi:hypothetical protein